MNRLAWLIALGFGLAWWPIGVSAQVSPGPLARAHQDLEGALKCTQCHGAGKDAISARCAACHRDIGWLATGGRGFHGESATKATPCAGCHPDHAGSDFQLIKWPEGSAQRFDHRRTGWPLERTHAKLRCEQCHEPKFRHSPAAALAAGSKSNWTGLETTCGNCHDDVHRGALGERCTSCHDAGKWQITPGFDHDTTDFRLAGKHRDIKCDQCHASDRLAIKRDPRGQPIPVFRPVSHQSCAACHRDVHEGSFGANCSACHSVEGFRQVVATGTGGFDHGRTRFPLRGKHGAVKCAGCHRDFSSDRGRRPASSSCAACHQPDPHGGAATLNGKPEDCAACHTETGFAPSTFPIDRHQKSRYPLEGKHLRVKCAACHRKDQLPAAAVLLGPARVVIRPEANRCSSCHRDEHGGQLGSRPNGGDCASCHQPAGWKPSGFDRAAHARLRLPLEGRHADLECRACHAPIRKGLRPLPGGLSLGKADFVFTGIEVDCAACHRDPHAGRFAPSGPRPASKGCPTCHDARAFLPAAVDPATHQSFSFPLGGAHRAVPCLACHREFQRSAPLKAAPTLVAAAGQRGQSTFQAPASCAECHRTPHGTQFDARRGAGRCDACHGDEAFAPAARFDHDRDAAFKLEGGHQRVSCGACHRQPASGATGGIVVYRPLSTKCESCHTK